MKKILFVISTDLLGLAVSTLIRVGTKPVIQISRSPEGFLGENMLIAFEAPSESTHRSIIAFLKRLKKAAPGLVHLLQTKDVETFHVCDNVV